MIDTEIYHENFKIAKINPIHKKVIQMLYQIIDQYPSCLIYQKYLSVVIYAQLYNYFNNENLLILKTPLS